jgi:hypothetical protein
MYQIYDFKKDIDFHIDKKIQIDLKTKSEAFKTFLFKLKHFNIINKIKESHPVFKEDYFLCTLYGDRVYVAKKINNSNEPFKFDSIEVLNGLREIRKLKLRKFSRKLLK